MKEKLMQLHGEILTWDELEELECNPYLTTKFCGMSGQYPDLCWYVIKDTDGNESSLSVYTRKGGDVNE